MKNKRIVSHKVSGTKSVSSHHSHSFVAYFLIAGFFSAMGALPALAVGVFLDVPPGFSNGRAEGRPDWVLRENPRQINLAILQALARGENDNIQLDLFTDVLLNGEITDRLVRGRRNFTLIGVLSDDQSGIFVLTVKRDKLAATIRIDEGDQYQVEYSSRGYHVVREMDTTAIPACDVRSEHEQSQQTGEEPTTDVQSEPAMAAEGGLEYDVMVVYTPQARDAAGGKSAIEARIQLAIDESNQIYANSGINLTAHLVLQNEVAYVESGDIGTDLSRLRLTADGHMDEVHV